jgi:hypothetical protein
MASWRRLWSPSQALLGLERAARWEGFVVGTVVALGLSTVTTVMLIAVVLGTVIGAS